MQTASPASETPYYHPLLGKKFRRLLPEWIQISSPFPFCSLDEKEATSVESKTAWVQTKFGLNMSATGCMLTGTNCFASLRLSFLF